MEDAESRQLKASEEALDDGTNLRLGLLMVAPLSFRAILNCDWCRGS